MISKLGSVIINIILSFGRTFIFLFDSIFCIFKRPFGFKLFITQMYQIGFQSSLVIALIGLFTGAVLAVQGEYTLAQFGATAYTGSAVALSLIRELGPVLTALMVIGRAGSAITAEIGIMKITEQIDALRSMAVNPIKYLMAPRILAGILSMPMLAAIFIVVGIFGGYVVGVGVLGLSSGTFLNQMISAVTLLDVYSGLIKALVFGIIFGWITCYKGYHCNFGAIGVNQATTEAVVVSSVAVLIVDYFLSSLLTTLFMP